jgi:predicted nucleotide-binding protein
LIIISFQGAIVKVKEIMTQNPQVLPGKTPIKTIREFFNRHNFRSVFIGSPQNFIGIITRKDFELRGARKGSSVPAYAIMSKNFISIDQEADVQIAINVMNQYQIETLAVKKADEHCGVITRYDIDKKYNVHDPVREIISEPKVIPKTQKERNIFIVHGHDIKTKSDVSGYIRELGLTPIILDEQADLGKTIIEKVEHYLDSVSFALVLLTGDDIGGEGYVNCEIGGRGEIVVNKDALKKETVSVDSFKENLNGNISRYDSYRHFEFACEALRRLNLRSRQNVLFELGITIGHLGREKVRVLYEEGVELPTDIHGLVYIPLNDQWKKKLQRELRAADIIIDP